MNTTNKKDKGLISATTLLIIGILMIFIPYDIIDKKTIFYFVFNTKEYDKLGQFISGVTSPFISISAFILLYMTYKSQKEELEQSRSVMENQSKTMELQRFENTFFQMLSLHHQIVNGIDLVEKYNITTTKGIGGFQPRAIFSHEGTIQNAERTIIGRDVFMNRYQSFYDELKESEESEMFIETYIVFYTKFQSDAGHYFRNVYRIIKLVDITNMSFEKKYYYTSIIRAQLSDYELLWLFYNCLSENGVEKFKPLVEKYAIFKNLPTDKLAFKDHVKLYNEGAFKRIDPIVNE